MEKKERIAHEAEVHFVVSQIFFLAKMISESSEALITAHGLAIVVENRNLIEKIQAIIMERIIPWHAETIRQHTYFFTKDERFESDLFGDVSDGFKILSGLFGESGERGLAQFNRELAEKLEKEWDTIADGFLEQERKNRTS